MSTAGRQLTTCGCRSLILLNLRARRIRAISICFLLAWSAFGKIQPVSILLVFRRYDEAGTQHVGGRILSAAIGCAGEA
jgi:hypothetical protein